MDKDKIDCPLCGRRLEYWGDMHCEEGCVVKSCWKCVSCDLWMEQDYDCIRDGEGD